MKRHLFIILLFLLNHSSVLAQIDEGFDSDGFDQTSNTFNPSHKADTTKSKKVAPRGMYVWTVDKDFGERTMQLKDTVQHMFMNSGMTQGLYGEYNTTGNLGAPRINRIFIERNDGSDFFFLKNYDFFLTKPENLRFTNTLSPITNLNYYSCGDKTNGEDYLKALFAVNASKQLGGGFKFNYMYGRGFYQNQSTALFDFTLWTSYLGDRYQAHAIFSTDHMKNTENGGITDDNYITHPEIFEDNFTSSEIPVCLSDNWTRNDAVHFFLSHRYSVGFNKKVPMTEEEIAAKKFAIESKRESEKKKNKSKGEKEGLNGDAYEKKYSGRPSDAKVVGDLPPKSEKADSDDRISVGTKETADSLLAENQKNTDEDTVWYKHEYVPVTSFIHTLNFDRYDRNYIAYTSPSDYYSESYELVDNVMKDSIDDVTKHLRMKNLFAISMLEGFNKWMKTGLKMFISHDFRKYSLPDTINKTVDYKENIIKIGGQISKTQGKLLHYNVTGDFGIAGDRFGDFCLDAKADVNIPLLGDTARIDLEGFFHNEKPDFYMSHYHSKHFWWDNDDMNKVKHTHVGGTITFPKTRTRVRIGMDNISDYSYLAMNYSLSSSGLPVKLDAFSRQSDESIRLFTAQLCQNLKFGVLNWENRVTYQNSSNQAVIPVPDINIWSNIYLDFKIARVLKCHFGADISYFSSYFAPEYCSQLGTFAVQENEEVRTKIGNYPFVNIYANFVLKGCRFFIMMSHVNQGQGNRMYFTTPHHPMNESMLKMGISWTFYN